VTLAELEGMLNSVHSKFPDFSLVVKGDPEADYAHVVEIIDLAGRLNIANLGLVTARIGT
jgi:biopolymer transport protein ExbD